MAVVAFIGLGQMGRPMSLNILRGGHSVQVFDVDRQAVEALAAAGASASQAALSPAGAGG